MAEKQTKKPRVAGTRRRRKPAGQSTALTATELQAAAPHTEVADLHRAIEQDGGKVLSVYREPYGGHWVVLAALPIELVEPTPYQRNLSDTHVRKLEAVISKIARFLDPIICVREVLDTERQSSAVSHADTGREEHRGDRRARNRSRLPHSRSQYRESP
jgi:ParB family chromosome partitioning protein